jgi:hypothetical protein
MLGLANLSHSITKLKSQIRHKNETNKIEQQSAVILLRIANSRTAGQ